MTRPTSVVLGLSAAAAALSLTLVNSTGVASAATPAPRTAPSAALPGSVTPAQPTMPVLAAVVHPATHHGVRHHQTHHQARRTYTVKTGDSFWSIAHLENVDWYNLAADNGLEMYSVLDAGQVLTVPAKGEKPHPAMPLQATGPVGAGVPAVSQADASAARTIAPAASVSQSGSSSFEQCVISRESGGNADVTNGSGYWGLFQFSPSTWAAYGGSSADFGSASAGEQVQVFDNAVAAGGESNWAPYDGC